MAQKTGNYTDTHDEVGKMLIRFLLGELPEAEREKLEERFFTDEELFQQLLVLEDDLAEAYASDGLSPHERKQFVKHLLVSEQQRENARFNQGFLKVITDLSSSIPPPAADASRQPSPRRQPQQARHTWLELLLGPKLAYGLILVFALGGGSWLFLQNSRLGAELQQWETERGKWNQQQEALQQQLAQERDRGAQLAEQLVTEQNQRAKLESQLRTPVMVSFALASEYSRSAATRQSSGGNQVVLSSGTQWVRLQLDLDDADDYASYRAVLFQETNEIWSQTMLPSRRTAAGRAVTLNLPADIFSTNDYALKLSGVTSAGSVEEVGNYQFRVVKR